MRIGISQTSEYRINGNIGTDCLSDLPIVIHRHTDLNYTCEQTDSGCFLKPAFRNIPYRNSFVPAIDIVVSHNDAQTILYIRGQPVKSVRLFMAFWFSFLLIIEIFLGALTITSKLNSLIPVFIPVVMCAFGYFLCKIATKTTFESVVKAIQIEFS